MTFINLLLILSILDGIDELSKYHNHKIALGFVVIALEAPVRAGEMRITAVNGLNSITLTNRQIPSTTLNIIASFLTNCDFTVYVLAWRTLESKSLKSLLSRL